MSLDIYFYNRAKEKKTCDHCGSDYWTNEEIFWKNITHNLGTMAQEAGIYHHLWRPDEISVEHPRQMIAPLEQGIQMMKDDPERFKKFSASNGWGTYEQFLPWLNELLQACKDYPDAEIRVSR
jgi:hypothetical protein